MITDNIDAWEFLEDIPQDQKQVLFLAMLFHGIREGTLTGSVLLELYISKSVENGDIAPLVEILRTGSLENLSPNILELLADHLEGKIKRKPGPIKTKARFNRDIQIISLFLELKEKYGYDKALDMLAEEGGFPLGRKAIEKIISDFNKLNKQSQLALKVIQ